MWNRVSNAAWMAYMFRYQRIKKSKRIIIFYLNIKLNKESISFIKENRQEGFVLERTKTKVTSRYPIHTVRNFSSSFQQNLAKNCVKKNGSVTWWNNLPTVWYQVSPYHSKTNFSVWNNVKPSIKYC